MAVYHKYRTERNASTWVIIAASTRTEVALDRYIKSSEKVAILNPFEIHVILLESVLENWRPYVIHLTQEISKEVSTVSA